MNSASHDKREAHRVCHLANGPVHSMPLCIAFIRPFLGPLSPSLSLSKVCATWSLLHHVLSAHRAAHVAPRLLGLLTTRWLLDHHESI